MQHVTPMTLCDPKSNPVKLHFYLVCERGSHHSPSILSNKKFIFMLEMMLEVNLTNGTNHTADEQALMGKCGISGEHEFATCPPLDELIVLLSFPMGPLEPGHLWNDLLRYNIHQ